MGRTTIENGVVYRLRKIAQQRLLVGIVGQLTHDFFVFPDGAGQSGVAFAFLEKRHAKLLDFGPLKNSGGAQLFVEVKDEVRIENVIQFRRLVIGQKGRKNFRGPLRPGFMLISVNFCLRQRMPRECLPQATDQMHGMSAVLFMTAVDALNNPVAASAAQRLKAELERYLTPAVPVLDELG